MKNFTLTLMTFILLSNLDGFSQNYFKSGNLWFRISSETDKNIVVVSNQNDPWTYEESSITVPASVTYNNSTYTVTEIDYYAFNYCTLIEKINLPQTIKTIGDYSFQGCSNLKEINLSYGLTSIGMYAFDGCFLLDNVTLPETLETIDEGVFSECNSIRNLNIPRYVDDIDGSAFKRCRSLKITVDAENPYFSANNGILFNKNMTVLISYPSASGNITIPEGVMELASNSFCGTDQLTGITFPATLKTLCSKFLYECEEITSLTIPASVDKISMPLFSECQSLTNFSISPDNPHLKIADGIIYNAEKTKLFGTMLDMSPAVISIPQTVTEIVSYAFYGCEHITNISIPVNVTTIGESAFSYCTSLKSIDLPDNIETIHYQTFFGCTNLSSVKLPLNCKIIESGVFQYCENLQTLSIPDKVEEIGTQQFYNCNALEKIYIGKRLRNIYRPIGITFAVDDGNIICFVKTPVLSQIKVDPANPYLCDTDGVLMTKDKAELWCYPQGKAAKEYNVPEGVQTLRGGAIGRNNLLEKISLPSSLKTVKSNVIYSNPLLTEVTCQATTPPTVDLISEYDDVITMQNTSLTLLVPETSLPAYKTHKFGSYFTSILAIGSGVEGIKEYNLHIIRNSEGLCIKGADDIYSLEIYDTSGILIKKINNPEKDITINLTPGLYFIKNGPKTIKAVL